MSASQQVTDGGDTTPRGERPPRLSLDDLFSPTVPSGHGTSPIGAPEDDADFQDLTLDDEARFSMISLQTPTSATALSTAPLVIKTSRNVTPTETSHPGRSSPDSMVGQKSPRLSQESDGLSAHESNDLNGDPEVSPAPLPFLLARLDLQKEILDADPNARRASVDGKGRLQEGFHKLQQGGEIEDARIDWSFWGEIMADYEHVARTQSKRLATAIEQGVPSALRGMVWQLMSASKDVELERTYSTLLKESSIHEKAITRDLGRTFPHHTFFMDGSGIGQENLFNVLKAYALYDPDVGYCQGLAFIVAVLLLNMPDEEAFCVLVRLMYSYNLRALYEPEMPGLQLRLYQFDRLVEELLPVLHLHFLRQGIKSSMYCSQWFLTMFSYRFPLAIVYRIFDHLFASGVEAIFSFALVLLEANEQQLLALKFDHILGYLKSALFDTYLIENAPAAESPESKDETTTAAYQADKFVSDALHVKITPFMLDSFAGEWEDICRTRNAHAMEIDTLRVANRNLSAQVKQLETSLAQMNQDHVEIVKQLVMAKVEREDMETELVKYKILYAEQMHHNEDAMSSNRLSTMSRLSSYSSLSKR